jgi:starvation-inducible DNA-binding protein
MSKQKILNDLVKIANILDNEGDSLSADNITGICKRLAAVPDLGIAKNDTKKLEEILDKILANQHVLSMKIHGFHWNIESKLFPQLHSLFDDQYGQLLEAIDATAERKVMLGGTALGSLTQMLKNASLTEVTTKLSGDDMIEALLGDHEACVKALRGFADEAEELGDMGTNDFIIGLMQGHEKMAWFLRAMV